MKLTETQKLYSKELEFVLTYDQDDLMEFEVYMGEQKIGYYYYSPEEKLFEAYYDYDEEDEEFIGSYVTDSEADAIEKMLMFV